MSNGQGGFTSASAFTSLNNNPRYKYNEYSFTSAAETVIFSCDPTEFISVQTSGGMNIGVDSTNEMTDDGDMSGSNVAWVEEQATGGTDDYTGTDTRGLSGLRFRKQADTVTDGKVVVIEFKNAK